MDKKDLDGEGGIEFEGVHIDDDPAASMVVMRRFLFYNSDDLHQFKVPSLKVDKIAISGGDTISADGSNNLMDSTNLTTVTNKSARRVTLFEGKSA